MEALIQLKQFYENGFLSKEEYESKRIALIDQLSNTHPTRQEKKVYANRHFDKTNEDAMGIAEYVVVQAPRADNKHLHTGAAPDNPFSYKTEPVPIDPNRGKVMPGNTKKFDGTTVLFTTTEPGLADREQQIDRLEEERKRLQWEMFYAAAENDVPKLKELLDRGADVDQRDWDTEGTPLMVAASKGKKHAVYYLMERGATIDARNIRGETALHEAVKLRFNEIALWLTKHGADIHLENYRGFSPYDLALPWLQKQLKDERDAFLKHQKEQIKAAKKEDEPEPAPMPAGAGADPMGMATMRSPEPIDPLDTLIVNPTPPSKKKADPLAVLKSTKAVKPKEGAYGEKYGTPINKKVVRAEGGEEIDMASTPALKPAPVARGPVLQEVLKAFLANGSYKSVVVTSEHTARDLVDLVAEKLNMLKFAGYLEVKETIRGNERRLDANVLILGLKKKWPLILGPTGNETELQCRFVVVPRNGTPAEIVNAYNNACAGRM